MHLIMNDVLECDVITFSLPPTPLTRGATHTSLSENLEAVFESIGLELVEYGTPTRQLLRIDNREEMRFQVCGELWLSRR